MKTIEQQLNSAELIYSHHTVWELKRYKYQLCCWKTEELPDECAVVCGILNTVGGAIGRTELGEMLGFAMRDVQQGDLMLVYRDVNEINLFKDILSIVEKLHLIRFDKEVVRLTKLGRIAVKENKLFKFYQAAIFSYEHAKMLSDSLEPIELFPFKEDMGIMSSILVGRMTWPEDSDVERIIYDKPNITCQYLSDQLEQPAHLYDVERLEYFEWDSRQVKISLYKDKSGYLPVVHNQNDNIAPAATALLNLKVNSDIKKFVVLECLFWKLWNDPEAVLDYPTISPYLRFIDFEQLSADKRTDWTDEQLFNLIAENATAECWRNISLHCDLDILETKLSQYQDVLDWDVLSVRVDDAFLIEHFMDYPWSLETISSDKERSVKTIQQLILLQKPTEESWAWEELSSRLEEDFIWLHLDIVDVDLRRFTKDTAKCRKAITQYPERMWDWWKIETVFSLDFLVSAIQQITPFLNFEILFDRMFDPETGTDKYLNDSTFYQTIVQHDEYSKLAYLNLNQKEYRWSVDNIRFLTEANLITWASTPLMMGFECNPSLIWDRTFFDAFASNIATTDGFESVSAALEDISILIDNPSFAWNWDAISCNPSLINQTELYTHCSDKLNWNILLRSIDNTPLIEQIPDIDKYLQDNPAAWTSLSEIVTVPNYIQAHRDYPWDWQVLTERMFPSLKLAGLSHPAYINKWNWTYLSENLSDAFINENLKRFCDHWDWDVLCRRLLVEKGLKLHIDYIDTIIPSINAISQEDKKNAAWLAFTSSYSFDELKSLMLRTRGNSIYAWDMAYFCSQPEFKIPDDLNECADCLDWDTLSSSPNIEAQFKYNRNCGLKPKAWWDQIRSYLDNSEYHWNYYLLSHFGCLNEQQWFLEKYSTAIDWNYVCAKSALFAIRDKQKLNELLTKFKTHIDIPSLANREDVDTIQIMKLFPDVKYDYNALLQSGKWSATEESVAAHPYYDWNWELVCQCDTFNPSEQFLLDFIEAPIDWWSLSYKNLPAWTSSKLIEKLATNRRLRNAVDWATVSSVENFPINQTIISYLHDENLNWQVLSKRYELQYLLHLCGDKVNWRVVSHAKWFHKIEDSAQIKSTKERLLTYRDLIDWSFITDCCWSIMDEQFLAQCEEYVDWNILSQKDYPFTKHIIERFNERWNWAALKRNRAYYNNEDIFGKEPIARQNIIAFLDRFKSGKPRAYHFAHMSNAVRIINEMKLKSRNAAYGKFEDSAGRNVFRTDHAHGFARFYFRPQSPTQFHNECLGRDKDMSYYKKYCDLGHPKCPLPVFFVIDIEELLTTMPNRCYYSNGNMQSRDSSFYKVSENPKMLNVSSIYQGDKNGRQQEFLVEDEVDLSRLNSLRICCYDEFQRDMLCEAIKDSPLVDRVEVDESLYIRKNRELTFNVDSTHVEITTDSQDEYVYKVIYEDTIPEVLNPGNIVWEGHNEIRFKDRVSISLSSPYKIYFESYGKKWLIYNNN